MIAKNPNKPHEQVTLVSSQGPKPYFLFHSLFQDSRIRKGEEEEEGQKLSTELTSSSSSTTYRQEDEDSIDLTLGLGVPSQTATKKRKAVNQNPADPLDNPKRQQIVPLNYVNYFSREETREEDVTWKIKKRLTTNDLGNMCRLLELKSLVEKHVLSYWDEEVVTRLLTTLEGVRVIVHDCDTNSNHRLTFKYLKSSNSYVFNRKWGKFVKRRDLNKDDQIGLYWDALNFRFMFSVLERAN